MQVFPGVTFHPWVGAHSKRDDHGAFWACARRSSDLGPVEDDYKLGCNREDRHISVSNPLIGEPRDFINEDVEFRQFSCPGCEP